MAEQLNGLVTRTQSGFFTVQTPEGPIICQLRGRLKEEYQETDPVALGDRVIVERLVMEADTVGGAIVEVLERERVLSRVAPSSAVGTSRPTAARTRRERSATASRCRRVNTPSSSTGSSDRSGIPGIRRSA